MSAEVRYNFERCCLQVRQKDGSWWSVPWATDMALCDQEYLESPVPLARHFGYNGA